jgi:protein-tyrosine phosphatase
MLDLHNHMLPGLDDGASSWEQSLNMAHIALQDGIEGVVCTPHWVLGHYENTRQKILSRLEELQRKLADHHIPLKLYPGSELRLDVSLSQGIQWGELLTINDTGRFAFIELPAESLPQNLEDFFWDLQVQKVTPIISHPERNVVLLRDPARLYHWVQMGILTQLTAASLLGHFGKKVQKFSTLLLEHNLVHIIATDAHGLRIRTPKLSEAFQMVQDILGEEMASQMVYETPKRIIQGESVNPPDPISIPTRSPRSSLLKRFLFKAFMMSFFLAACTPGWGPPIKEIHPGAEEIFWDQEKHVWAVGKPPVISPSSSVQEPSSVGAIQKIKVSKVPRPLQEKPTKYQRLPSSIRDYIREKFKGKQILFPEELPQELANNVHRIGPDDVLHVIIWTDGNLDMDVVVRTDGKISLPLVGEVQAAGLEISELESRLRRKYSSYIENPQVTVTLKEANSLKVFITGAVKVPTYAAGPITSGFPLRGDRRLLTALSQVEILPDADLSEAYIVRGEIIIPVDLSRLLKDGDMTQNVLLKPADTIVIPGSLKEVTILGEVENPGRYRVKRRTTLLDALAKAGGIKRETAALDLSYVERGGEVLPVDFKRLIDLNDLDQNILLENDDIVHIASNQENKVFVLGEVAKPGVVRFVGPMDVLEAISEAGDFLISANRKQVVVVRGGPQEPKVYAINALKMMAGYTHEKFILNRYDIVYVPRTLIADWNVFITQLLPTISTSNLIRMLAR